MLLAGRALPMEGQDKGSHNQQKSVFPHIFLFYITSTIYCAGISFKLIFQQATNIKLDRLIFGKWITTRHTENTSRTSFSNEKIDLNNLFRSGKFKRFPLIDKKKINESFVSHTRHAHNTAHPAASLPFPPSALD
jgi:hypothetical protein